MGSEDLRVYNLQNYFKEVDDMPQTAMSFLNLLTYMGAMMLAILVFDVAHSSNPPASDKSPDTSNYNVD